MTTSTAFVDSRVLPRPGTRSFTSAALLGSDVFALLLSVTLSVAAKAVFNHGVDLASYFALWPFLFVFLLVYAAIGLYSGLAMGAPEELRRATIASAVLFITLAAATVTLRGANRHFTWTLVLAMVLSMVLVPLIRACTRQLFGTADWWGLPAVIFGAGEAGESIVRVLKNEPGLGIKPIAIFDENPAPRRAIAGVPVLPLSSLDPFLRRNQRLSYGVFAMPDVPKERLTQMIEAHAAEFSHVLVVPDLKGVASLWVDSKSIGGMVSLEVRQHVSTSNYECTKRTVDVVFVLLGALLVLPVSFLIACWIALDSRGAVFYSQLRIGRNGCLFRAWKFRSMVVHADQVLQQHLQANPALYEEWQRDQKLKDDPRVTSAGKFLRRSSLDELPQLWNVLKGDMSLVGPRPIVENEVERYGTSFETYKRVNGGITGLWQVSGRNDISYHERVELDMFYVRNWSVWLDMCILFRTIAVVLFRKGAY